MFTEPSSPDAFGKPELRSEGLILLRLPENCDVDEKKFPPLLVFDFAVLPNPPLLVTKGPFDLLSYIF
jgi:hypothetical protein